MAIERGDIHTFKYFDYGEAFYGSYNGMRYRVAAEPLDFLLYKSKEEKDNYKIRAYAWPEPDSFSMAKDKVYNDYPFCEESIEEAVKWLNEQWERINAK